MKTSGTRAAVRVITLFVAGAALIRVIFSYIPEFSNFSPVAAMALFGGYYLRDRKVAFSLPLLIMLLSDAALEMAHRLGWREYPGFHPAMPFVYAGFLSVVALGGFLKNARPFTLLAGSLLSSLLFFIISNFGVWTTGNYPSSWDGLIACYTAAIPFFRFTIAGDLFFVVVMFGGLEWIKSRSARTAAA